MTVNIDKLHGTVAVQQTDQSLTPYQKVNVDKFYVTVAIRAPVSAVGSASGSGGASGAGSEVTSSFGEGAGGSAGIGTAAAVSQRYVAQAPIYDVSDGAWLNELGGTNLTASIDEDAPDDADYIRSEDNPASSSCEIALGPNLVNPGDELIVEYRLGKSGTSQVDLTVALMQGASTITTWTHTNVSATPTTISQSVTGATLASITDFSALSVKFTANKP